VRRTALRAVVVASALIIGAGCSGSSSNETEPPCESLAPEASAKCIEERFWPAYQRPDVSARRAIYEALSSVIRAHEGKPAMGRVHFLRGTLGMALSLENQLGGEFLDRITPDLDRAVELAPDEPKFPPWPETMRMVLTYVMGDMGAFDRATKAALAGVELYPTGNILTVSGVLSGFPLDTGLPAKAIELIERWKCDTDWCMHNTEKAPFSQPGLMYQFADDYARVADREHTRDYLERALAADAANRWTFRSEVEGRLADLDGYLGMYKARGTKDHAIFDVIANKTCLLCHAVP
jgi:hypothetical protein